MDEKKCRRESGIPEDIQFKTTPQITLQQIGAAVDEGVTLGVVVADAGYGVDGNFSWPQGTRFANM